MKYFIIYLLIINIIGFVLMGLDKFFAIRNIRRISENTFFILAIIGASIGSLNGMVFFRHKISKRKFFISMPIIFVSQLILIYLYIKKT